MSSQASQHQPGTQGGECGALFECMGADAWSRSVFWGTCFGVRVLDTWLRIMFRGIRMDHLDAGSGYAHDMPHDRGRERQRCMRPDFMNLYMSSARSSRPISGTTAVRNMLA